MKHIHWKQLVISLLFITISNSCKNEEGSNAQTGDETINFKSRSIPSGALPKSITTSFSAYTLIWTEIDTPVCILHGVGKFQPFSIVDQNSKISVNGKNLKFLDVPMIIVGVGERKFLEVISPIESPDKDEDGKISDIEGLAYFSSSASYALSFLKINC